ncbi:tRNA pseudouridine(38-40) synthase TruA [Aggregatimonas sangjinii]|uniref:tRNA pseudouridine synthase A n=1 Tax=Aggregatimonas sangjinii TaxID=2583587 RepID=A0A5B7SMV2_9FLAO|nr:tRNA pseudouridine(38-40) synthase TruA [Aggregatimonas sangjinii]QCW99836.1 tRNA pseudouridine(38-40) synthase TruA [Aggregatimonas sangjinii]
MPIKSFRYLIKAQFLGFRYSGWQQQPGQKTIEGMLLKTLKFIVPDRDVKILGAGRTDAKVSALDYYFELFVKESAIDNLLDFTTLFNENLPADIRIVRISLVDADFNIIQGSRSKEYVYLFSFGEKNHPFCAPFMANIITDLNIDLMKQGALLFEGTHHFSVYTARLRKNSKTIRTIDSCRIKENTLLTANFFPPLSYALHISGAGFMRYQVRMIMGALIQLGKGELTLEEIESSLQADSGIQLEFVAPGSGLLLNAIDFK